MQAATPERAQEIFASLDAWYFATAGPMGRESARPLRAIVARKRSAQRGAAERSQN
jgi:hypothetical protein